MNPLISRDFNSLIILSITAIFCSVVKPDCYSFDYFRMKFAYLVGQGVNVPAVRFMDNNMPYAVLVHARPPFRPVLSQALYEDAGLAYYHRG